MHFHSTKELSTDQKEQNILDLWNCAFPETIALEGVEGLEQYLARLDDHHHILLLDEKEIVKGWFFDFIRDEERWFIIMVAPELQGGGWGRKLITKAKATNEILNGWIVDTQNYQTKGGQPYLPPVEFYKKLGFEFFPEIKLELPQISSIKITWRKNLKKQSENG